MGQIKAISKGIQEKEVERYLTFILTEDEVRSKGIEAANVAYELGKKESEFDEVKKEWKKKIDRDEAELKGILSTIRAGKEDRHVKCLERKNFETHTVQYIYDGYVMFERPMEEHEMQFEMMNFPKDTEVNTNIAKEMTSEKSVLNA